MSRFLCFVFAASFIFAATAVLAGWAEPKLGATKWDAVADCLALALGWLIFAELHKDR